jgi:hypothetical protein
MTPSISESWQITMNNPNRMPLMGYSMNMNPDARMLADSNKCRWFAVLLTAADNPQGPALE